MSSFHYQFVPYSISPPLEEDYAIGVLPALSEAYRKQGFEMGYVRGASMILATALEAIEPFLQSADESASRRHLLYAFCNYLDQQALKEREAQYFSDGLGI